MYDSDIIRILGFVGGTLVVYYILQFLGAALARGLTPRYCQVKTQMLVISRQICYTRSFAVFQAYSCVVSWILFGFVKQRKQYNILL